MKLMMQVQSFLQTTIDSHTKVCIRHDVQLLPHAVRPDRIGCLWFYDMYAIPNATRLAKVLSQQGCGLCKSGNVLAAGHLSQNDMNLKVSAARQ